MKLIVCVKQVPRLDQVRFDRANRIVREDIEAVTNPLDLRALGHALALRERHGGEVVALTMGPPQAREALADAIRRGADRGVHLLDKRFAGSDTLATARAVARAIEREGPDLVLLGRSTLDGATAQVGPQVAELAGLRHLTQATELSPEGASLRVERETERGSERWTVELPALISVERGPAPPDAEEGRDGEIEELTADDLRGSPRDYGTRGSPTFVKEVRELTLERRAERVEGVEAGVERILELAREHEHRPGDGPTEADGERKRAIWVLAERDRDGLHPVSLEGISCARLVAGELAAEVVGVLLCGEPDGLAERLAAHGADRVLVLRHPELAEYEPASHVGALCAAIEEHEPYAVIAPWTAQGRDYVPRAAARLGLGLTGDFVRLEVANPDDEEPDLMWIKPAWAGTVEAPIVSHRSPALGTLRPGACPLPERREGPEARIDEFEPRLPEPAGPECRERRVEIEAERLLDDAQAVVCMGENADEQAVESGRRLAGLLGGALGATAGAVERGLVPPQLEIGVEKRSIAPLLVLALGVAEAEPLDAIRAARTLVTVHPDPEAPAHERADLAVVAEPGDLPRALISRLDQPAGAS